MTDVISNIKDAKAESRRLAALPTPVKDSALSAMADALDASRSIILEANARDVENARSEGLGKVMLKRLLVDDSKIDSMIAGIRSVISLKDPVGDTLSTMELDDGLTLYQISCPIGLIGVIFESRPDVVPQIMSLCLKSGNGVVFKGGREATETNRALFTILRDSVADIVPASSFVMIETREDVNAILGLNEYIDLLIPRGSNEFVRFIQQNTSIPVLGHAAGICHVYVDSDADMEMAWDVALDSKVQYPAVCNAMETLLVNADVADRFLPRMCQLLKDNNVEIRCDTRSMEFMDGAVPASEEDWDTEYNDYVLSVRVVDSVEDAVEFINTHGSHHTDAIITKDPVRIAYFVNNVDSADVFVNASTRFADGFRFGKGAEVGISTNKIHSRGPVGMEGLMIYKYVLIGEGQVVKDYVGNSARPYKHMVVDKALELR
ncbi:MAG: glutamate-5-semialdehyde dehydrogenase [Candidatus Methanomethylophilaceae archaeon]|nr:glutamate-5-semialdehyde dehydrogenase [Candidatus Methanomethylophilaceae archaeon]